MAKANFEKLFLDVFKDEDTGETRSNASWAQLVLDNADAGDLTKSQTRAVENYIKTGEYKFIASEAGLAKQLAQLSVKTTVVDALNLIKGTNTLVHKLFRGEKAPMGGRKEKVSMDFPHGDEWKPLTKYDPFEIYDQKMGVDVSEVLDCYDIDITLPDMLEIDEIWNNEGEVSRFVAVRLSTIAGKSEARKEFIALVYLTKATKLTLTIPKITASTPEAVFKQINIVLNVVRDRILETGREHNRFGFPSSSSEDSLVIIQSNLFKYILMTNVLAYAYHEGFLDINKIFKNSTTYNLDLKSNFALREFKGDAKLTDEVKDFYNSTLMIIYDKDVLEIDDDYTNTSQDRNGKGRYNNLYALHKQSGCICRGANALLVKDEMAELATKVGEDGKLYIGFPCANINFEVSVKIGEGEAVVYEGYDAKLIDVEVSENDIVEITATIKDFPSADPITETKTVQIVDGEAVDYEAPVEPEVPGDDNE